MFTLLLIAIAFLLGFFTHMVTMKVSFKQRTIDNKIKIYDLIITAWVRMRNVIVTQHTTQEKQFRLNEIYGESQAFIGDSSKGALSLI